MTVSASNSATNAIKEVFITRIQRIYASHLIRKRTKNNFIDRNVREMAQIKIVLILWNRFFPMAAGKYFTGAAVQRYGLSVNWVIWYLAQLRLVLF